MPLQYGKSKEAFGHNIGAEINAGKPRNQALAIAYSIKRKNAHKMAHGGMYPTSKDAHYASGGDVEHVGANDLIPMHEEHAEMNEKLHPHHEPHGLMSPMHMAEAIHAKHMKHMAAGGEVDDDFLSDEEDTAIPDEDEAGEMPEMKRKRMLSKAFDELRKSHQLIKR